MISSETFAEKYCFVLDHKVSIDVDQMNRDIIDRDRNLWDALESSKWLPIEQLETF